MVQVTLRGEARVVSLNLENDFQCLPPVADAIIKSRKEDPWEVVIS